MATEVDHIAQANRNHAVLEVLLPRREEFPEWVVTVAFYKAVHVVEAAFAAALRGHSTSHQDRLQTLKMPRFHEIHKHFRPMYAASCVARYLQEPFSKQTYTVFSSYMPPDKILPKIIKGRLDPVEQNCLAFLSPESARELKRSCKLVANLE